MCSHTGISSLGKGSIPRRMGVIGPRVAYQGLLGSPSCLGRRIGNFVKD